MFKQWCLNKFSTNNASYATHLFMDGGKIHVPQDKFPLFIRKYYDAITSNEHTCCIEKLGKNCIMRYFLDIDFKNYSMTQEEKFEALDNILTSMQTIIDMIPNIYICSQMKGVHVVYNKACSYDSCIEITTKLLNICKTSTKYVDNSVYNTGLRMIGSFKYSNRTYEERSYLPYDDILSYDQLKHSIVRIKSVEYKKQITENITPSNEQAFNTYKKLNEFINKQFINDIEIYTIVSLKQLGDCVSFVTSNKYCFNVKRQHKNAKVYFVFNLKTKTCYQKCFCRCMKTMPFDTQCKDYKSYSVKIPYLIYNCITSF